MDLNEMHVWFRQYAQQMGMQNVRAILPEQIDVLINTSISDTVNEVVRTNIGLTNDRVITDNAKLGQINALRTLYSHKELRIGNQGDGAEIFVIKTPNSVNGKFVCTDFFGTDNSKVEGMYLADLSIYYRYSTGVDDNSNKVYVFTSLYPVRPIDNMYLADTLQDFVLKPRFRSPIAVYTNNDIELYLGDEYLPKKGPFGISDMEPYALRVGYIKYPAKVQYLEDAGGKNVDCDLPDYMHVDILKHAVDLYRVSIQGSLYANQQQQQAQQREIGRNNVRPDNEGYQQ